MKKTYFMALGPALLLFALFFGADALGLAVQGRFTVPGIWHGIIFTCAAVTGVAGPVFVRALFAHRVKDARQVAPGDFYAFQTRLILITGITPYIAFAATALSLPRFHAGAVVLMALYSLYYYFPSARRINFDEKIFRVTTDDP